MRLLRSISCFLLLANFLPAAETDRPFTIVMFGDSTTAFRPGAIEKVYSVRVEEAFADDDTKVRVVNRGVGGDHTDRARARFEKDVLSEKPDLVVIQFGINDSAVDVWKDPPATGPRVSRERYLENLRHLIEELEEAGTNVILMTPNPLRWVEKIRKLYGKPPYDPEDPLGFEKPFFRGHVDAMRGLAREMDVPLVDIYTAYSEREDKTGEAADSFLLDGVHPNDAGQALVAEQLLPEIRKAIAAKNP